jgi:hypothetical protein
MRARSAPQPDRLDALTVPAPEGQILLAQCIAHWYPRVGVLQPCADALHSGVVVEPGATQTSRQCLRQPHVMNLAQHAPEPFPMSSRQRLLETGERLDIGKQRPLQARPGCHRRTVPGRQRRDDLAQSQMVTQMVQHVPHHRIHRVTPALQPPAHPIRPTHLVHGRTCIGATGALHHRGGSYAVGLPQHLDDLRRGQLLWMEHQSTHVMDTHRLSQIDTLQRSAVHHESGHALLACPRGWSPMTRHCVLWRRRSTSLATRW